MRRAVSLKIGAVGRQVPGATSLLRPRPERELAEWGGPALVRGKRVLDLGCGDGRLALGVAPYAREVHGLDPDAELVRTARARARASGVRNARFGVGAAQELPYDDASFDVVILSWSL